eukprot:747593-Hanusia_phi.AAC.3
MSLILWLIRILLALLAATLPLPVPSNPSSSGHVALRTVHLTCNNSPGCRTTRARRPRPAPESLRAECGSAGQPPGWQAELERRRAVPPCGDSPPGPTERLTEPLAAGPLPPGAAGVPGGPPGTGVSVSVTDRHDRRGPGPRDGTH